MAHIIVDGTNKIEKYSPINNLVAETGQRRRVVDSLDGDIKIGYTLVYRSASDYDINPPAENTSRIIANDLLGLRKILVSWIAEQSVYDIDTPPNHFLLQIWRGYVLVGLSSLDNKHEIILNATDGFITNEFPVRNADTFYRWFKGADEKLPAGNSINRPHIWQSLPSGEKINIDNQEFVRIRDGAALTNGNNINTLTYTDLALSSQLDIDLGNIS